MISRPTAIGIVGVIVVIIALILNHEDKRESEEPLKNKPLSQKTSSLKIEKLKRKNPLLPLQQKKIQTQKLP